MLQFISQVALCLLLILTTVWCVIVHRKLSNLRHDEGPLRELVHALNQATAHADQTIVDMRTTIRDADRRAVALHELSQRLEARARAAHEAASRPPAIERSPTPPPLDINRPGSHSSQTAATRKAGAPRPIRTADAARVDLTPDRVRLAKSIECLR